MSDSLEEPLLQSPDAAEEEHTNTAIETSSTTDNSNEEPTEQHSEMNSSNSVTAKCNMTLPNKILILITSGIILGVVLPKNNDLPSPLSQYISSIIGYTYFLCWSISFYPQVLLNQHRKNTTGLSPDFSILNVVGFTCYSIYVSFLFWSPIVRDEYQKRFHENNQGGNNDGDDYTNSDATIVVPVQSNDVAFAIHALILSVIQVGQIMYYHQERQERRRNSIFSSLVSTLHSSTRYFLLACLMICIIYAILVGNNIQGMLLLDYLYMLSSIKLVITIVKYIPQAALNYQRKSTIGWNIWNVLLDFSGGLLSLTQLFVDAFVMDDFSAINGNWIKFGLGFVSLFFDVSLFVFNFGIPMFDFSFSFVIFIQR